MSKVACPCGNILSDCSQQEMDEDWGYLIKNGDWFNYQDAVSKLLSKLFEAYQNNTHIKWLENNCPVYSEQPLQGIINDIMSRLDQGIGRNYAACNRCGSLLIQESDGKNIYGRFQKSET